MIEYDWRSEYLICEHLAENKNINFSQRGFKICCKDCASKGFLFTKDIKVEKKNGLEIGTLIEI